MNDRVQVYIYATDQQDYHVNIYSTGAGSQKISTLLYPRPAVGIPFIVPMDDIEDFGTVIGLDITAHEEDRVVLNVDDINTDELEKLVLIGVTVNSDVGAHLFFLRYQQTMTKLTLDNVLGLDYIQVADSIAALLNLRTLQLRDTAIGIQNAIWNLNELVRLRRLEIISSEMNRLPDVEQCTNLAILLLNSVGTEVLDTLEDIDLSNMTELEILDISCNTGGSIPDWIYNLDNIEQISLSNNRLTGEIPPEILSMNLYSLDLSHNQLIGAIPVPVGNNIGKLDLSHNQLVGDVHEIYCSAAILSHNLFTELGNIEVPLLLDLSYNNIVADIDFGYFNTVDGYTQNIDIYGNDFGDMILPVDVAEGVQFTYNKNKTIIVLGSGWQLIEEEGDRVTYQKLF